MSETPSLAINLTAAIVAVEAGVPVILATRPAGGDTQFGLPSGPFDPLVHRTFEAGLRGWVREQTALDLGYVEQLYTFGDRGRHRVPGDRGAHTVSVGYLALTRLGSDAGEDRAVADFRAWYDHFPWEDWSAGRPEMLDGTIIPLLSEWAGKTPRESAPRALGRRARLAFAFGPPWDEEKVLDRYELLYEAGLVPEAARDGRDVAPARENLPPLGVLMRFDHRRILATAMGRLRAKLKYRPVIFEMMPDTFTLTMLQRTVEAIAGRALHKQNFRRLVEANALVEPTGERQNETGGRPAQMFRFRREVFDERPAPGLRFGGRG